jgi:hypothetical protein
VCWLFPGKTVRVDALCLDCGDPVAVEVRDGVLISPEPRAAVGYSPVELATQMDWAMK